jgi:hypothetical protein
MGLVENSLQFKINNHFQTLSASLPANNVTALKAVLLDRVCGETMWLLLPVQQVQSVMHLS